MSKAVQQGGPPILTKAGAPPTVAKGNTGSQAQEVGGERRWGRSVIASRVLMAVRSPIPRAIAVRVVRMSIRTMTRTPASEAISTDESASEPMRAGRYDAAA